MISRLQDLKELRRPGLGVEEVVSRLPEDLGAVSQGLYVFVFENETQFDILDRNKKPKVIIRQRGSSLKPGKFEQGFATRIANYCAHLHHAADGIPRFVFSQVFAGGFLFDLSAHNDRGATARVFEPYWLEGVNDFIREENLLPPKSKIRGEWRQLTVPVFDEARRSRLKARLEDLAERIEDMQAIRRRAPNRAG